MMALVLVLLLLDGNSEVKIEMLVVLPFCSMTAKKKTKAATAIIYIVVV